MVKRVASPGRARVRIRYVMLSKHGDNCGELVPPEPRESHVVVGVEDRLTLHQVGNPASRVGMRGYTPQREVPRSRPLGSIARRNIHPNRTACAVIAAARSHDPPVSSALSAGENPSVAIRT